MKTTINSFQGVVAAFAVAFVFVAMPFTASAFDFDFEFPDTLPDLTTENLTLTQVECNIHLSSDEIVSGGSVTISWDTAGLDEIKINGETVTSESGSVTIDNITENTNFELVGTNNNGGSCTASAYLVCLPPVVHPPECELDAHPQWIDAGETTTLTWTTENAKSATLSGTDADYGSVDLNGSLEVGPLYENAWYMLNIVGDNGEDEACKVDVYVHKKDPKAPECPIDPKDGRIIVEFVNERLFSGRGETDGQTFAQSINVPAGTYDIRLVSYDGYASRVDADQKFEQYQLEFMDGNTPITRSSAISDLADFVIEDTNDEVVNRGFVLSQNASKLRAVHAFVEDTSSPNSLYPICAAIDPISEEPKECELEVIKEVNKDYALPGEELTYTITVKSTGTKKCTGGGVRILDEIDPNITYLRHDISDNLSAGYGNTPVYVENTRTLWFNGHDLYPGEVGTITWVGKVNEPEQCGDFKVKNQAKSTAKELNNFKIWSYSQTVETHITNSCEPELPSCDFFTANPTAIDLGESTVLSWGTTNVDQVFINNGIGNQPVDGSLEVSPIEDTTYVLTAIGAKDKVVDCHVRVEVDETPERPMCPFTPSEDTIVYEFDERLRSDQSLGNSQTKIQATTLEAGKYDIQLASWDGYPSRVNVTQPNERWQLQFLASDAEVGISNSISDLEDTIAAAFLQETVNEKYVLANAADGIRAVHAVYPDNSSANSVNPICAAVTKIEEPAPSCDLFTANPTTITVGDSATLTWETTNATRVAINNGVGSDLPEDGTIVVSPTTDTVYTMTVFGADDQSVDCEVPVKVSEDQVPVCKVFTATPGNLPLGGGDVVLDWEVEDATSVTISPTVGSVDLTGSTTVNVTQSTTYTLTAVDANGDEVSCIAPVTVPDPVPFTCEGNVTFGASPNSVRSGDVVTLTWNVNDADSVSISGINATAFSGTETVNPTSDTTYVLTATKGNETIECPTNVTISTGGGGGGSSSPRCELDISDERISLGEEITLTWDTSRANDVTLVDDLGNVIFSTDDMLSSEKDDYLDGEITLSPTRDTEYTLLAERGSRDRTCRVSVDVEDDLVILETRDQQPLVAGISLTAVPYTGFEAGPFMTFMFYALLVAWAFYITYLIVARKRAAVAVQAEMPAVTTMRQAEETRPDVFVQSVAAPEVAAESTTPSNLPTATPVIGYGSEAVAPVQETNATVTAIEDRAHAQKALLSSDAVRYFVATTEGSVERDAALDEVIAEAKKAYPLEDGWIVINESRMQNLCEACKVNVETAPQTFSPAHVVPEGSSSLAEAIVTGNVVAAYEMIGHRPMFSLADAAADLDAVYRKRQGEDKIVSELLSTETENLSDAQIKNMITALTSALDGTYTDEASAVKMAIMKAVKEVA